MLCLAKILFPQKKGKMDAGGELALSATNAYWFRQILNFTPESESAIVEGTGAVK